MRALVTGGAGFIGSHIIDRLLSEGHEVICYDNLSTGTMKYLEDAQKSDKFTFVKGDLLDPAALTKSMDGVEFVYHFAANADIRFGLEHPRKDLEQNTIATFNVLEAMRLNDVKKIVFSSTAPVYGEAEIFPTPETHPMSIQTSLYGASKLACEGLIEAYAEGYGFQGWIYRFVSILGERYPHGHIYDFYKKLKADPTRLEVLGNGKQRKSYLYIKDCLNAIWLSVEKAQDKINIFNLGVEDYVEVNDSVKWITEHLGVNPKLEYTGGDRGWVGDNPFIFLDVKKIISLGWKPEFTIEQSVKKTVDFLKENEWLLDHRH